MQKSESIKELAAALAKAQGQMTSAKKDAANPFFKSKYADLASIVEAIKGPLSANGLSYSQFVDTDDAGLWIETILMHSSGEWISGRLRMPVAKPNDPQALGSAVTYGRRYGLQAACGVPADDDDANAASGKPGIHRPDDGVEDRLTAPQRIKVQGFVEAAKEHLSMDAPERAQAELSGLTDPDERVYANTFFDSKERAAMKKAKESMKNAA